MKGDNIMKKERKYTVFESNMTSMFYNIFNVPLF